MENKKNLPSADASTDQVVLPTAKPETPCQEAHDPLTGLPNLSCFRQELDRIDKGENLPLTVVLLDVNKLKLLNDSLGYAFGDLLLKSIAATLVKNGRPGDVMARNGNDEFGLILPQTDEVTAMELMKRIQSQILVDPYNPLNISVAFGFKTKRLPAEKMKDILHLADQELIREKSSSKTDLVRKTVIKILTTLFARNRFEREHSENVGALCEKMGKYLGFHPKEIHQLKIAGRMHDIGKITISDAVLHKKGQLSRIEWAQIKNHAEAGYQILNSTAGFSAIATTVLEHHERWDGTGYPKRLKGEAIHLNARIIAVVEAYDTLTAIRSYRKQMSKEEAFVEIQRCAGTQFDPNIVKIFIENYSE
ncbi:MAG: HD domain-containing phosphohydrolase [bacterium]